MAIGESQYITGQSPSSPPASSIPPAPARGERRGLRPPPPAMSRRRPRGGEQGMDAAIDHSAPMRKRKADVRSGVNRPLRDEDVYGKEDVCCNVVQEEQDKLQQQEEDGDGGGGGDDDDEAQQQEAAMIEPPLENAMPIVMVDSEAQPSETVLAVEQTGEVIMDMLTGEVRPRPASTGTGRTRRPCYGWISDSESDSDYEEFLARRQKLAEEAEARRGREEEVDEIFEQGVAVSAAHASRQEDSRIVKEEQAKKWIDLVSDSDEDDD